MNDHPLPRSSIVASLREIAQALSAAWDLDTTLDLIARRTNHVMGTDSCSIYLLEPDGGILRLRASTRLARESLGRASLRMGEGLTGWAALHGKEAAVREAKLDPRFKLLPETNEEGLKSLLAVPLTNRGRVIGAMNVQTSEFHDFSADEAELLMLIGDLAAGALDRAILYDGMNRRLEELTTLAKVSQTVTSQMVPGEMLELVAEMTAQTMGVEVCALHLIDEERGELELRAAWSRNQTYRRRPPLRADEGVMGEVIRGREPVMVDDVRADPRYRYQEMAREEGLVSMLAVPLIVREKAIGVMACYTTRPTAFTAQQIALLSTLANQTALAIENARLLHQRRGGARDAPPHQEQSANRGHAAADAGRRNPAIQPSRKCCAPASDVFSASPPCTRCFRVRGFAWWTSSKWPSGSCGSPRKTWCGRACRRRSRWKASRSCCPRVRPLRWRS